MGHPSPSPGGPHLEQHDLGEIVAGCREERSAYRRDHLRASPCCMELFRRAFAHDQAAWQAIQTAFDPLVRAWIGAQRQVEPEDVIQETFLAFARYAPNHLDLLAGDEIDRILGFLRRCAKTALLTLLRRTHDDADLDSQSLAVPAYDDGAIRAAVRERLKELLATEEERRVFFLRFECDLKPQQIVAAYSQLFPDAAALYDIIQRITRRLRKDPGLRELYGLPPASRQKPDAAASLEIRISAEEGQQAMSEEPCRLGEARLLDYVTGAASAEMRRAIERSPVCLAAARRLAHELGPLLRRFYRLSCPDAETLIAYQERRLAGTDQLLAHSHIAECPLCREECVLLAQIDVLPLNAAPGLARRLVEALFQPALGLPQPLRGELLRYATPHVLINLSMRKAQGQPRSWVLRGQARTPDGRRADGIEAVMLRSLDDPARPDYQGQLEAHSSFVFRELPPGNYGLRLLTAEEEIVIRRIVIGGDLP
jgi:hypothetical protein